SGTITTNSFTEMNLVPNTSYSRVITSVLGGSESSYSLAATTFTLAAAPGTPTFPMVAVTSVTVTWGAQGNSAATPYEVQQSTMSGANFLSAAVVKIPFSSNVTVTSATFTTLQPATNYFYRIRARNGALIVSPFSGEAGVTTLNTSSNTPSGLAGTAV